MPAKSKAQQKAAGAALAAKRGDIEKSELKGASSLVNWARKMAGPFIVAKLLLPERHRPRLPPVRWMPRRHR